MSGRHKISQRRRRTKLLLNSAFFWNFLFQQIRSGQNLPALCQTLDLSYNAITRKINSTSTLRRRYLKARSAQLSRIQKKWIGVEQEILEEHFEAGKSAAEFRRWQEALEDPKPGNQQDEPGAPFRDLRERMGMTEMG